MASIEATSRTNWRSVTDWSATQFDEAIDVILFLLRAGSRRTPGLFAYLTYLSRVAHAFRFNGEQFPNVTKSTGKDVDGIASNPHEHFIIAHHLNTLKAHNVRGDFYEFGCFKGFSTSCLSFACKLLDIRMHVFDSFQGLPPSDSQYYSAGDYAATLEEVQRNVRNFGAPEIVTFNKGFFADVLRAVQVGPIAAIWLDVDLESSARDAMAVIANLDQRGCIFSHECVPKYFADDGVITIERGPNSPIGPIVDAFVSCRGASVGRYLVGYTGVIWDPRNSIPPPAQSVLKLFDALTS